MENIPAISTFSEITCLQLSWSDPLSVVHGFSKAQAPGIWRRKGGWDQILYSPSLASPYIFQAWNGVSGAGVKGEVEGLMEQVLLGRSLLTAGCISLTDWLSTRRSHLLMEKHIHLNRNSSWLVGWRPGFRSWLCHQLALWRYARQSSPLCIPASPFILEILISAAYIWSKNKVRGPLMDVLREMLEVYFYFL